jgi:hypothetical protein
LVRIYNKLKTIAEIEYKDIVTKTALGGKRTIGSTKLRVFFRDHSYLDIYLGPAGKYSYHWEWRPQRGLIYRHDNAPDFSRIKTYPKHFHNGSEKNVKPSYIDDDPQIAVRQVLDFVRKQLAVS